MSPRLARPDLPVPPVLLKSQRFAIVYLPTQPPLAYCLSHTIQYLEHPSCSFHSALMSMSWPVKSKQPRSSLSSETPSNVKFTFIASSKLDVSHPHILMSSVQISIARAHFNITAYFQELEHLILSLIPV